jgi:hypothetical protein
LAALLGPFLSSFTPVQFESKIDLRGYVSQTSLIHLYQFQSKIERFCLPLFQSPLYCYISIITLSTMTTTTRSLSEQIHWMSIMDVLCGRAPSLYIAKSRRYASPPSPEEGQAVARAEATGLHGSLAWLGARDPQFMKLYLNFRDGLRWGDIMWDEERDVQSQIEAIRASGVPGRWRQAAALYNKLN